MTKSLKNNLILFTLITSIGILINACSDDTNPTNPPTTFSISGTITFVDTTKVDSGGFYNVSAFNSWFPAGSPSGSAVITTVLDSGVYTASFSISGLSNGNYYLASAWTKNPYQQGGNYVLGTYGCDTNGFFPPVSCNPDSVAVNGSNINNINFYSYLDTAKSLVNF